MAQQHTQMRGKVCLIIGANSGIGKATGLQLDDLARYEQHQRRIRVAVNERLRPLLLVRRDDLLLPTLERLVEM